jgi:hypothetical protein
MIPRSVSGTVGAVVIGLALLGAASCNRVNPIEVLEPVDVVTGWYDVGVQPDGKNKLVPSITLRLRNKSSQPIRSVQVNAVFRRVGEEEMWGEHFGWAIQREPLQPGETTEPLVLRSQLHGRAAARADAREQAVRRRQGRNIPQARVAGLG